MEAADVQSKIVDLEEQLRDSKQKEQASNIYAKKLGAQLDDLMQSDGYQTDQHLPRDFLGKKKSSAVKEEEDILSERDEEVQINTSSLASLSNKKKREKKQQEK